MNATATANTQHKYILWGSHPSYGGIDIKITGADSVRSLRGEQKSRNNSGWSTVIRPATATETQPQNADGIIHATHAARVNAMRTRLDEAEPFDAAKAWPKAAKLYEDHMMRKLKSRIS